MKEDLIAVATAAREKRELFLQLIDKVSATYHEGGEDYNGDVYQGHYSFSLNRFFSKDQLAELFAGGYDDLVFKLYHKVKNAASYSHEWLAEFDTHLAEKMVELWSEEELRQEICNKFTSLPKPSFLYRAHLPNFEKAIIATENHELIMLMIDKSFINGLSDKAQEMIFIRQDEEEIFYLMHQYNLNHQELYECDALAEFQIKILKDQDADKQHRLIDGAKLMNSAQMYMYEHLPKEFYYKHLNKYGVCQDIQMIALKSKDRAMCWEIFNKHCFAPYGASDYFVEHCPDEEFFCYKHKLDPRAEIILLKQGDLSRIFYYVDMHGLSSDAIRYMCKHKLADAASRLVMKKPLIGSDLQDFLEFASPQDIVNNLKSIGYEYAYQTDIDACFKFLMKLPAPMLIAEGLYAKKCSPELAKQLWKLNHEEICRSLVVNMYCDEYEEFVFNNSDIDMLKSWHRNQNQPKKVPENLDFGRDDKDFVRFLLDNCTFSSEEERIFLEQRSEEEGVYYINRFYPNAKH